MDNKTHLKNMRKDIVLGLEKAYEKLVEFKRYKKSPLIVSENGEVLEIEPEKIEPKTVYKYKKAG